jgi:holliday junction DNA helicase RuvA
MIEMLRGIVAVREHNHVVLDCGGVGYGLEVPHSTFLALPEEGREARLLVHFKVTESEMSLFGFATELERRLFRVLMSVQGIGGKLALVLLSTLAAEDMIRAIREEDLVVLTSVPGIGEKTAKRLCVELREPMRKIAETMPAPAAEEPDGEIAPGITRAMRDQAVTALAQLGTKPAVAVKAVSKACRMIGGDVSVEKLIVESLRQR